MRRETEREQDIRASTEMMKAMAQSIQDLLDDCANEEIEENDCKTVTFADAPTSVNAEKEAAPKKGLRQFSSLSISSCASLSNQCSSEEWYGLLSPEIWPTKFDMGFDTYPMPSVCPDAVDGGNAPDSQSCSGMFPSPKYVQSTFVNAYQYYGKPAPNWSSILSTDSPPLLHPSSPQTTFTEVEQQATSPDSKKMNLQLDALVASPVEVTPTTTFMIRNIPNKYTRDMMLEDIAERGFKTKFDFFYLPIDFRHRCNVGYAFINLISEDVALEFAKKFNGTKLSQIKSSKVCVVAPAKVQGQMKNADQYRYSTVMNMQEKYQPVFFRDGEQIPFPPPAFTANQAYSSFGYQYNQSAHMLNQQHYGYATFDQMIAHHEI